MADAGDRRAPVREAAPAKLNLGLRVVARRADGFHELDSLFAHLDLADALTLAWADRGVAAGASSADRLERAPAGDPWLDALDLPLGPENLVRRAWSAYRGAVGELPPVRGRLAKRVPWGAGLGGGSADAAAALRGVARLAPGPVDLAALAEQLGSDVPFCLAGHAIARVGGRGEVLTPVDLPPRTVVLVNPGVAVAAGDAYRWWGADPVDAAPMDEVLGAWRGGAALPLTNALQAGVAARVPEVAAALATLRAVADGPVAMSGSGSTCFAVVADPEVGRAVAAAVATRHPAWWVRVATAAVAASADAGS
jgi:4-diphosphocytidyl-2-C-methyl-D-erythritol kinase